MEVNYAKNESRDVSDDDGTDSDDSFEILGHDSLDMSPSKPQTEQLSPLRLDAVQNMKSLIKEEILNLDSKMAVSSSTSSFQDVESQVQDLIRENESLKTALCNNSEAMNANCEKMWSWKGKALEVANQLKAKLAEAKRVVDELQEKNCNLQSEIDVYRHIKRLQDEEIIFVRNELKSKTGEDTIVDTNHTEVDAGIKIQDLENALAESNMEKSDLAVTKANLEEKLTELQTTLNERNTEKEALALDVENLTARVMIIPQLEENILELQGNIASYIHNGEILEQEYQELFLKSKYGIGEIKDKVEAKEYQIQRLSRALEGALKEIDNLSPAPLQLSETQMQVTSLNHELREKYKEIEELRHLLTQTSSKDEVFALKSQLEVYAGDYEAEKASKNELKKERDQLAEDLKNVQIRNTQLQNEIETLRGVQAMNVSTSSLDSYLCPKCSFGFTTYQALENHVNRCLDLEESD